MKYHERQILFREGVISFFVQEKKKNKPGKRDQGVGQYCKGADVEECRKYFGERSLPVVCSTCPD